MIYPRETIDSNVLETTRKAFTIHEVRKVFSFTPWMQDLTQRLQENLQKHEKSAFVLKLKYDRKM